MGDAVNVSINLAERYFPNFSVILSVINLCEYRACEHQGGIQKINTMLRQIGLAFVLIPFEFHES